MAAIRKTSIATGVFWVEVPTANVRILCGCPADSVKHMMRRGLIVPIEIEGVNCESGPNAILLSDLPIQNGNVCSRSEFPVLQMLYRQGMLLPNHPGNTGAKPMLIGSSSQVTAQMDYIFRGNYGLVSKEELITAEVEPALADEIMRMKLAFAFGRIQPSDELVQPLFLEQEAMEIANGVVIRRLRTNVFEIAYQGEHAEVNLNLASGENYECPYSLDMHLLEREYFSVIHTGDGDGWDMNRPAIGSIVLFQGRIYLVDAGPNIDYTLNALGIGVNEIEGIFHTHGHDDHLAGLTVLIKRDKRIPYYAVPMVRSSVMKKLSAAMQLPEKEFEHLFDFRDLKLGEWNNIEGLEVKPLFSPHPVETTIFYFRAIWEGGYKSYAHLADIASFDVLSKMVTAKDDATGISPALFEKAKNAYLGKATIKKIDIGGGMIHGNAADFRHDASDKLILSHTARKLTLDERTIGSGAPFGTTDVLIKGVSETLRNRAFGYLSNYFPNAPIHMIRHLMNGRVIVFNPESLLLRQGQVVDYVYLILTGLVQVIHPGALTGHALSAGSLIGETEVLLRSYSVESYRADNFVHALRFPKEVYFDFVQRNQILPGLLVSREKMDFLRSTFIFSDAVSCVTLSRLVDAAETVTFEQDQVINPPEQELLLIRAGSALFTTHSGYEERLEEGSHAGVTALSGQVPDGTKIRFLERTLVYKLALSYLLDFPIAHWKLIETHRRRYLEA